MNTPRRCHCEWDLRKLSPAEFYQYRLSGIYPLQERARFSNGYIDSMEDELMETWPDKEMSQVTPNT